MKIEDHRFREIITDMLLEDMNIKITLAIIEESKIDLQEYAADLETSHILYVMALCNINEDYWSDLATIFHNQVIAFDYPEDEDINDSAFRNCRAFASFLMAFNNDDPIFEYAPNLNDPEILN